MRGALAKQYFASRDFEAGFAHLERAHIIGQAFVLPHARTHCLMLRAEWQRRRFSAVLGQGVRIILGVWGSAAGVVPVGNTGGSDVSMFKRMPIAAELQMIIDGGTSHGAGSGWKMPATGSACLYDETAGSAASQDQAIMGNKKVIAIVLLAVGAILLYFGFNASQSPVEEVGEALTGRYSDSTMMYLVAGGVAAVAGLVMLLKK